MSTKPQQAAIDFTAARARRDAGMTSSADHAEADAPGWGKQALALMARYADLNTQPWTVEQFRGWAYGQGLARPDEERAFGSVTQTAVRRGFIERVGYAPAASSNGSAKPLYSRPADDTPIAA